MKAYQIAPFGLRMQPELREYLTEQAQKNFRSLNNEIIQRLEASRQKENAQPAATGQALVTQ
ncbi:Arc family DNA-binding protein [Burkholderia sp. BDU5]|uniref:Arc family DNA-binding protein n=1 Tax=Burkholderia sp. BDU5 TaxID=1385590 RepID=UPI000ACBAC96|nr:Arc family DNA-binding protein [Burkholderia sp. BDU5]